MNWKKARFMEQRLGDEFDAIIVGVTQAGLFVELFDLFIEGLVPLSSFSSERFDYRENLRALVGARSKRQLTLGDRIRVRADRVSFDDMRTEFSWLGESATLTKVDKAKKHRDRG
jgi:ribonuclease R